MLVHYPKTSEQAEAEQHKTYTYERRDIQQRWIAQCKKRESRECDEQEVAIPQRLKLPSAALIFIHERIGLVVCHCANLKIGSRATQPNRVLTAS
jgi:hypothetical protein